MPVSSPVNAVLDQLADLARWDAELASDPTLPTSSLVGRLSQVPDRRQRRGVRHWLLVVLVLSACATLVLGGDSVTAIRQWAARTPQEVLERLGARRDPWRGRYLVPGERQHWTVGNRLHWIPRCHLPRRLLPAQNRNSPPGLTSFRNLAISTFRLAGRASIAHARRDLLDRDDVFAAFGS